MICSCSRSVLSFISLSGRLVSLSAIACGAAQVHVCPLSSLATVVWRLSCSFYGLDPTEPKLCRGIPLPSSCSSAMLTTLICCVSLPLPVCFADHSGVYPPPIGVNTASHLISGLSHPDLPSPLPPIRVARAPLTPPLHREEDNYSPPPSLRSTAIPSDRTPEPIIPLLPYPFRRTLHRYSPDKCRAAPKPTFVWGNLAIMVNLLIIFDGFIEVITEAGIRTTTYLSYMKNSHGFRLLVDSPGQSTSPSSLHPSFSSEMRAVLPPASLRTVFLPNTKWRCVSLSIAVLSSCVAARLGPEDATDVVLTIFRGADWILTSRYKVTKSQVSGTAVLLAPTHLKLALNSLSFYLR
ncbi:hypothetical protein N665_0475s0040 [Sinapis alba]|nr:hypothetical protein N665_0475s0040 [Sinapis alba]